MTKKRFIISSTLKNVKCVIGCVYFSADYECIILLNSLDVMQVSNQNADRGAASVLKVTFPKA